jgi:hypothetical protein
MEAMISFVDAYRDKHGVEPICKVLPIAPSTYHAHVTRREKPETALPRVKRDVMLSVEIRRVLMRISRSTACAKSGVSCSARGTTSPAARWRG